MCVPLTAVHIPLNAACIPHRLQDAQILTQCNGSKLSTRPPDELKSHGEIEQDGTLRQRKAEGLAHTVL